MERDGNAKRQINAVRARELPCPEGLDRYIVAQDIGFLEEVGSSFKIPMLYRDGLNITQGKAFEAGDAADEE